MENQNLAYTKSYIQHTSKLQGITAAKLVEMEFPEPKWAIPDILPEGLNILGGKPKKGKSILALNICLAIASGGKAFDKIHVEQGTVIYFALEDTNRRLQERIQTMLNGDNAPEKLILFTEISRMDKGGLEQLEVEIKKYSDLRLVVIDTLAKFRPSKNSSMQQYNEDYQQVGQIKDLADKYGISILLIHHLTKQVDPDDVMDTFSGTLGLTGAADGLLALTMKKGETNTTLEITGRDVEKNEFALSFDQNYMQWKLRGDMIDIKSTPEQQKLYNAIKESTDPVSPKEIEEITGLKIQYIKNTLPKLLGQGCIRKAGVHGKYEYINHNI